MLFLIIFGHNLIVIFCRWVSAVSSMYRVRKLHLSGHTNPGSCDTVYQYRDMDGIKNDLREDGEEDRVVFVDAN